MKEIGMACEVVHKMRVVEKVEFGGYGHVDAFLLIHLEQNAYLADHTR